MILNALLPWVYWSQPADKCRQPQIKNAYQQAASSAYDTLIERVSQYPIPEAELQPLNG